MSAEVSLVREGSFARVKPTSFLGGELWETYRQATAGARFDRARRVSLAPLDKVPGILARLRKQGFRVRMDPELRVELQKRTADQWMQLQAVRERIDSIGREFEQRTGNRFFPYQHTGAVWLAMKHTCMLADDMGLGKTMQAIVALPSGCPTLVVCPASIKGVWKSEVEKWRPHVKVTTLSGRGSFRWPRPGEMVVTNYDVLPVVHKPPCDGFLAPEPCEGCAERVTYNRNGIATKDTKGHLSSCKGFKPERPRCPGCATFLEEVHPGTVGIGDEAHKIKHGTAKRTISFRALFEAIRRQDGRTWALTGTPVENQPNELWSILTAVGAAHEAYGSWKDFLRLANARPKASQHRNGVSYGFEWGDPDDEFVDRLRRVSLRRMKRDVLPQLPTKTWRRLPVDIDARTIKECDKILKKSLDLESLLEKGTGDDFETLATLRKLLATAKVPSLLRVLDEYEEYGELVVVFSMHREPIDHIGRRDGWETITGDVDPKRRSEIVKAFQDGDLKGLACTIQAAGEGLTLTRANQAIFVDLSYKPTANEQAEDRLVRIGQTRGVVITLLEADHPIDRRVNDLLTRKQRIIASSVDASKITEEAAVTGSEFESQLREVQEDVAAGRAVRRMAESEEERKALEGLHVLEFETGDERIASDLAEQADVIGLSDRQWELAVRVAGRGREAVSDQPSAREIKKGTAVRITRGSMMGICGTYQGLVDGKALVTFNGAPDLLIESDALDQGIPAEEAFPGFRFAERRKEEDEVAEDSGVDAADGGNLLLGRLGGSDSEQGLQDDAVVKEEGDMPTKPKKDDPLEPIMLSISQLTDDQRAELFDELEEVYCVSCGENVTDLEDDEEHDCPCPDEDEDEEEEEADDERSS